VLNNSINLLKREDVPWAYSHDFELERLSLDEEIESELKALKKSSINNMEERVEALETIMADNEREATNHEQI